MKSMDRNSLVSLIGRLSELARINETPVGNWFFTHAICDEEGNAVPVGKAVPFEIGQVWQEEAAFFSTVFRIPESLNGRPVWLRFRNGGENLLRINGRAVQGFDADHEACLIGPGSGQNIPLEIEATQRWQNLAHAKRFGMDYAPQVFLGASVFSYDDNVLFVRDLLQCLLETDAYPDWQTDIRRTVDPDDCAHVYDRCRLIREKYAPRMAAEKSGILLTLCGHSHLDLGYLWPIRETHRKALRTFSNILALMERSPEMTFAQSQMILYKWVQKQDPILFGRIKSMIRADRWETVGGMMVETDGYIPSPESMIRQFLHGISYCREELGTRPSIAWLPDTFGLPSSLPQILKGCGMTGLYTAKLRGNDHYDFPFTNYKWEGIDGTQITAHLAPFGTYSGDMTCAQIRRGLSVVSGDPASPVMPYMIGFGDGGGGTTGEMLRRARILPAIPGMPAMSFGTCEEAFRQIEECHPLPVWREEMYLDIHQATLTSRARIKQMHRRTEICLYRAELLSCAVNGRFTEKLKSLWESLMLYQFHDILPGSCQKSVADETEKALGGILLETDTICRDILNGLTSASDGNTGTLVNLHPFSVPAPAEYASGLVLPPFSLTRINLTGSSHGTASVAGKDGVFVMDNGILHVLISTETGNILQLTDLRSGREYLESPAGFVLHQELYEFYDAWNLNENTLAETLSMPAPTVSAESSKDGLSVRVSVCQPVGDLSVLYAQYTLESGSAQLVLHVHADWHETGKLLRYQIPTSIYARDADYDMGYGVVSRSTGSTHAFEKAQIEVCTHKWMDLSDAAGGLALLNDCKYGGIVKGKTISQSLLRAPCYPDPDSDRGEHDFSLAILPHNGICSRKEVHEAARLLNDKVILLKGRIPVSERPLFPWHEQAGVCIGAIKAAHDGSGSLIVRLYENSGGPSDIRMDLSPFAPCSAYRCDMLENVTSPLPEENGEIVLSLRSYEIATVRIVPGRCAEDAPLGACSGQRNNNKER